MSNDKYKSIFGKEVTRKEFLILGGIAVVAIFPIIGILRQLFSHAQTPSAISEAESGTQSNGVTVFSNSTASGGEGVRFGTVSPPPSGGPGVMQFTEGPHGPDNVDELFTATQLQEMASYGFKSFTMSSSLFVGQAGTKPGGGNSWSGTPDSSNSAYDAQFYYGKASSTTSAAHMAHAAGLQVYLYFYLAACQESGVAGQNLPPGAPSWSDNTNWDYWNSLMQGLGGAIAWMGFDGVMLDTEVEGQNWQANGPGTTGDFGTSNTLAASRGKAWVEAMNTGYHTAGGSGDVPIYVYQSLPQRAQLPGGYCQYYCAHFGNDTGVATGINTSLWAAFVLGMAQGTTAPIYLGDTIFYDAVNVWGSPAPYGTSASTGAAATASWNSALNMTLNGAAPYTFGGVTYQLPGFNNQRINMSGVQTPLPHNVYLSPMLWVADNTENTSNKATSPPSGVWTTGEYAAALPALKKYAQGGTWSLFQGGNYWINYADNVGQVAGTKIPPPGYVYAPVDG
jgi:hypothetical protein